MLLVNSILTIFVCYEFRDRITGDDIIATSFIYMSQISGQGEEGGYAIFLQEDVHTILDSIYIVLNSQHAEKE